VDVQPNWWQSFFQGVAVDMWLKAVPPEHTRSEADHVDRALGLASAAEVLDVPCGGGRISFELAARGYRITGVDQSPEFLEHARAADTEGSIEWQQRDMRDLPWPGRFDGAYCVGNSFGYLDDDGDAEFLRAVATALKPGGRFVLQTPMIVESLLPKLSDRPWFKAGDMYLLVSNEYDPSRGRLDIEYTFVSDGRVEVRRGSHRAYAYRQLLEIVERAGFAATPAEPWTRASEQLTLACTRR
jgi:SAM-dependent methyltransferase